MPETVLEASLAAPAHTLRALTPHVDFIARIDNGEGDGPRLDALETVDTSGDWGEIAARFGGTYGERAGAGAGDDRLSHSSSAASLPRPPSTASSLDDAGGDDEPTTPTLATRGSFDRRGSLDVRPRSNTALDVDELRLQADADRRTINGLRASLKAAEAALRDAVANRPPAPPAPPSAPRV